MDLLKKLLILLPQLLLVVDANNFSITGWNITNQTNPNGVDETIVQDYTDFMNCLVFGNPIENAIALVFSEAFKDCRWCYPPYTCLQIGGPFITPTRPINLPPYPPSMINMKLELYTRKNPKNPFKFEPNDIRDINESNFNSSSDTKFTIGGFVDGSGYLTAQMLTTALLTLYDVNVFIVDWSLGSMTTYEQAVANTRLVGAMLGYFIELLKNVTGYPLSKCHLIGHSLGSHISGYAGEFLSGMLGRITGLDPAGPYFEKTEPPVRLDPTDAKFVDVMHTDSGSILAGALGLDEKIGHIDFSPNGGSKQPGCAPPSLKPISQYSSLGQAVADVIACNHERAVALYNESIFNSMNGDCQFNSYTSPNYATFQLSPLHTCDADGYNCAEMGFNAYKYAAVGYTPAIRVETFFLYTNAQSPYCRQ